jgi:hypothetical protein
MAVYDCFISYDRFVSLPHRIPNHIDTFIVSDDMISLFRRDAHPDAKPGTFLDPYPLSEMIVTVPRKGLCPASHAYAAALRRSFHSCDCGRKTSFSQHAFLPHAACRASSRQASLEGRASDRAPSFFSRHNPCLVAGGNVPR